MRSTPGSQGHTYTLAKAPVQSRHPRRTHPKLWLRCRYCQLLEPRINSQLSNHAENMVGDLVQKQERTKTESRKILIVAHSLGGLVY